MASQGDPFSGRKKNFEDLGEYVYDDLSGVAKVIEWISKCTLIFDLMKLDSIPRRELDTHNLSGMIFLW